MGSSSFRMALGYCRRDPRAVSVETCRHCGGEALPHQGDHPDLCCDCFEISLGHPLDMVNAERAERGLGPLSPWPDVSTSLYDWAERAHSDVRDK